MNDIDALIKAARKQRLEEEADDRILEVKRVLGEPLDDPYCRHCKGPARIVGHSEDCALRRINPQLIIQAKDGRGNRPFSPRISDFRKTHLQALQELFLQVLVLCREAGLVKLGHVALDGTRMKANASKHKAMSFDRMTKRRVPIRT